MATDISCTTNSSLMKTISFGIANYCVPCNSHCRHCLLKSCGKATGVDQEAGMAFADRVLKELKEQKPEVSGFYYIGYCMDTPKRVIRYMICMMRHTASACIFEG